MTYLTTKIMAKALVAFAVVMSGLGMSTSMAMAKKIDLSTPEGAIAANRKIQCSTIDNKPEFYTWSGRAYARKAGMPDKVLFGVEGMNVRQCVSVDGGKKGTGYRLVTREIMLYTDLRTGKPLDMWVNPYLGQEVKVMHVENDPVNQPPRFPYTEDGKPAARWWGREDSGSWFMTVAVPLFYHNVLQGDYQKYVGGAYHATEMFNFMGEMDDLTDGTKDTADAKVGWVRISDWLPWMEMQGREGLFYVQAAGKKVKGFEGMPQVMQDYINTKAPIYKAPPPGDDDRKNETSWTYFQKLIEGGKLPRGGHN